MNNVRGKTLTTERVAGRPGLVKTVPRAAFEKNSKSIRRPICVDFDFTDFSGLRGSDERDRTTPRWDWLPDAVPRSTSLWNWILGRVS